MKKFADLTLKGQKMRIVRDAIAQIKSKRFVVSTGTYLDPPSTWQDWEDFEEKNLQKLLLGKSQKGAVCECCAKGALFASCVISVNKVTTSDNIGNEEFQKKKLKKWFKPLELDMIEAAFEQRIVEDSTDSLNEYDPISDDHEPNEKGKRCISFGCRYDNEKKRLLAILNNILQNGEFKP